MPRATAASTRLPTHCAGRKWSQRRGWLRSCDPDRPTSPAFHPEEARSQRRTSGYSRKQVPPSGNTDFIRPSDPGDAGKSGGIGFSRRIFNTGMFASANQARMAVPTCNTGHTARVA
jgi:hypothetical protein